MYIDAAGVTPVHSRVGEMLKMVTCAQRPEEPTGCAERPHPLKHSAKVLILEMIRGDQGTTDTNINGNQPVLSTKQYIERFQRKNRGIVVMSPDERTSSQQDARPENPVVPDFFFQGKPRGQRHVELIKILWLKLSNHISGIASSHGHIFEPQQFSPRSPRGWSHQSEHGHYHGHDRSAHMGTSSELTQVNDFPS